MGNSAQKPLLWDMTRLPIAEFETGASSSDNSSTPTKQRVKGMKEKSEANIFNRGDILRTVSDKYEITKCLGEGAFGVVYLGWDHTSKKNVAIKMIKDQYKLEKKVSREICFLDNIKKGNGHLSNLLIIQSALICRKHYCLVLEALEEDLHYFMFRRKYTPLSLRFIRPILEQLLMGLSKLEELKIIHTDLRAENIMIINRQTAPLRIKIIDFGNAIFFHETNLVSNLQNLQYRAPEMLVGMSCTSSIDMWSVGCLTAFLYMGTHLYNGHTDYDQVRLIWQMYSTLDTRFLVKSRLRERFFKKLGRLLWTLKSPREYTRETGKKTGDSCRYKITSLDDLMGTSLLDQRHMIATNLLDKRDFVDLLKEILAVDPAFRISPERALLHPFLTKTKMLRLNADYNYVRECYNALNLAELVPK